MKIGIIFLINLLFVVSCVHHETRLGRNPALIDAEGGLILRTGEPDVRPPPQPLPKAQEVDSAVKLLPTLEVYAIDEEFFDANKVPSQLRPILNKYFSFLKLDPTSPTGKVTLARLLFSSTQFLNCPDFENWDCLESPSLLTPNKDFRQEAKPGLGRKIQVDQPIDIKAYFTTKYFRNGMGNFKKPQEPGPGEHTLAMDLGEIIDNGSGAGRWGAIDMALFGIDDLEKTMKPVWSALLRAKGKLTRVRGVFDIEGLEKTELNPIYVSYRDQVSPEYADKNLFTVVKEVQGQKKTLGKFEYRNSVEVIKALNQGVRSEAETQARIEWPITNDIMHNKFFVFSDEDKNPVAVWTGTANIAKTCMGQEANANMGIFIKNSNIANVFLEEFKEMYEDLMPAEKKKRDRFVGVDGPIVHGKFHTEKRPQTQRYFSFNDGTEVRVHFSPTDDGEHRSIIPTLLSARDGDEIRISMFASGGIEYVRALQYAVAKGANVKIVFDRLTNAGCTSWINNVVANIREKNPYAENPKGTLEFKVSNWSGGKNHHKTGTLTRFTQGDLVPEVLIIGSQNWTAPGNDKNDENMLTIRNLNLSSGGLAVAGAFNKHFDEMLWKVAMQMPPRETQDAKCRGESIGVDPESTLENPEREFAR